MTAICEQQIQAEPAILKDAVHEAHDKQVDERAVFAALRDPLQLVEALGLHQAVLDLGLCQLLLVLCLISLLFEVLVKLVLQHNQGLLGVLEIKVKFLGRK